jgi:ATP-dependent DNA helicase RecG
MNRLVQGDVGSGKTVVAALGILSSALNSYQSVLMAPTEVLAVQHYQTLEKLLPNMPKALLTAQHASRNGKKTTRANILEGLADQETLFIVGTHSLIQKDLHIPNLGLAIIDEQHRFGVEQRKTLMSIRHDVMVPHLLSLTATPIPRTLALTLYGDLELSTIKQMPQGRKPIITRVIDEKHRAKAYQFIRQAVKKGEQIFILCPLINESDKSESKSVLAEYARLKDVIFPDLEIRYLHGKLKSLEKKKILDDFKVGAFPILVTTSVIEVGIDIPKATIMVIEGAERFGIAQLHQFRGRVGRNDLQSYCLLFTDSTSDSTKQRLTLLTKSNDGFALAEADMKLRGEGEVFGTRQSGIVNFKIATLRDTDLIQSAKKHVQKLVADDMNLAYYKSIEHKLDERVAMHWE